MLPTDDVERHTSRKKFLDLLRFSKEVQVYARFIKCMNKYDEIRYPSACVEPPVPKCYLGQLDAQNDVLVLENLGHSGRFIDYYILDVNLDIPMIIIRDFNAISIYTFRISKICRKMDSRYRSL